MLINARNILTVHEDEVGKTLTIRFVGDDKPIQIKFKDVKDYITIFDALYHAIDLNEHCVLVGEHMIDYSQPKGGIQNG